MAKDKKQKDISINDLAVMMNNRFDHFRNEVKEEFDAVNQKLKSVDQKFDAVNQKLKSVDQKFDAVNQKLDRMEDKTDTILIYAQNIDKELSKLKKDTEKKETSYVTKSSLRKITGRD